MLKPFQIRDLHTGESSDAQGDDFTHATDSQVHQPRNGIVQLASSDYDELALHHPRARLTYVDDDDADLITVGSSFELSQRLDEPVDPSTTSNIPETMHIFDIRRSNSVTELWKKFECPRGPEDSQDSRTFDAPTALGPAAEGSQEQTNLDSEHTHSASDDTSAPLLAAFEAEMAKILQSSENDVPRATSSSTTTQTDPTPDRPQNPADAFTYAMRNLIEGAELISSGVRSRIPEFERHLQNAQNSLPENVGSSVQTAITALEAQVKNLTNALNNVSSAGTQGAGNIFNGQLPTAAGTVDGLRTMASELGNIGQTLYEAFESELRGSASHSQSQPHPVQPQTENAVHAEVFHAPSTQSPTPSSRTLSLYSSSVHEREPNAAAPPTSEHPMIAQYGAPGNAPYSFTPGQFNPHSFPSHPPPPTPPFHHPPPPPPPPFHHPPHFPPFQHRPPHPHFPPFLSQHHHHHHHHRPPPIVPPGFIAPIQPIYFETSIFNPHSPNFWARPHHRHDRRRGRHGHGSPASRTTLFVGNVGFNVNEKMISDVFASKGLLVEVNLPLDSGTGKHAGFGYLHFPSMEAATAALEALQGLVIDGHSINLECIDHTPVTTVPQSDTHPQQDAGPPRESRAEAEQSSNNSAGLGSQESLSRGELETSSSADAERLNSLYPSLLPLGDRHPTRTNNSISELLPDLTEVEARFPPVSQQDAHIITGQSPEPEPVPEPSTSNDRVGTENLESHATVDVSSQQSLPGSFPQDPHDESRPEAALLANPWTSQLPRAHTFGPSSHFHGRRAASTRSAHPGRGPFNPFDPTHMGPAGGSPHPLRRRNTDRHPHRGNPLIAPNVPRHTTSFYHPPAPISPPRPTPPVVGDETVERSPKRQQAIDECVARLVTLGYGSEEEGGRQRMAVYAAAADGEVADAIEIIEEERKVYEQRQSTWTS